MGIADRLVRRTGSKALSLRPVGHSGQVAPLPAVAHVVRPREHSESDPRVSVRVEVVATEPVDKAAGAPVPGAAVPAPSALESRSRPRGESEGAQLMAAGKAAVAYARGVAAYRDARDVIDTNALNRGVCVRVRV